MFRKRKGYGFFLICALAAVLVLQPGCTTDNEPASESAAETSSTPRRSAHPAPTQPGSAGASTEEATATEEAAEPQPRTVTLPEGTELKVRTTTALSTKTHKTGDTFTASLKAPLVEGNWVIAPKGSTVQGRIAEADEGGRVKGVARLAIQLTQFETADGQTIPIRTNARAREAKTTKKKDATKVGIATGIGAGIGAIVGGKKGAGIGAATGAGAGTGVLLATRGDPAVFPSETVITFKLASSHHGHRKVRQGRRLQPCCDQIGVHAIPLASDQQHIHRLDNHLDPVSFADAQTL